MAENEEVLQKLQTLNEAYRKELPSKLEAIQQSWETWLENEAALSNLEEFHQLVHRLAGSSTSFGFAELGLAAKELDQILIDTDVPNNPLSEHDKKNITQLLNQLLK